MKTIVSFTSFPARIKVVHQTIETILNQTIKPDLIVLYLAAEQFPNKKLPKNLTDLIKKNPNVQIRWTKTDLRSYKKLVPALCDFPNDLIITIDDDILYPNDLIATLLRAHRKNPNAICGCRVKRILVQDGKLQPYKTWKRLKFLRRILTLGKPRLTNFATTGGGTLFPAHCLHSDTSRDDIFMTLCPTTDDLWFWACAARNGTKTIAAMSYIKIKTIADSQTIALSNDNLHGQNLNDKNINLIINKFPELKKILGIK